MEETKDYKLNDYKEFRVLNFKGFDMYFLLVFFALSSIVSVCMIILFIKSWFFLIFIPPTLIFPFFLAAIIFQKVKINKDYIEVRGIFKNGRIYFKDVKRFGVYYQNRFSLPFDLDQDRIDKVNENDLGYMIYLSTNEDFDLKKFKVKYHVRFPFKREIFNIVKENMETHN